MNYYEENSYLKASNINEAIKEFINNTLYFDIDINRCEIDNINNCFIYSVLCDNDNSQIKDCDSKLKEWEKGEINLYTNDISLYIYELNLIKSLDK